MLFILIQLIKKLYHNHPSIYRKKEQSLEIFAVSYTAAHHTNLPNFSVKSKQKQAKSSIPYQPLLSRPAMFCPQIQTAIHIL